MEVIFEYNLNKELICCEITENTCKYLQENKVDVIADVPYYNIGFDLAVNLAKACNNEEYEKDLQWKPLIINRTDDAQAYLKKIKS